MGIIQRSRSRSDCQLELEEEVQQEGILSLAEGITTEESNPLLEDGINTEESNPRLEDIITEDGIFSTILSSLSLVEAVRTSVLSPRWRQLWPLRTKFDFDAANLLDCPPLPRDCLPCGREAYKFSKGMTPRFIHSVNSILPQLQGARIDEFSVCYFLDKTHSQHLDAWLKFAFSSQAKVLRFHLYKPYPKSLVEPYEFPCHLLGSSSSESSSSSSSPPPTMNTLSIRFCTFRFCTFKLPCNFDGLHHLKLLKVLSLVDVDLTQDNFNHILSNCSSTLMVLCLSNAPQLVSFNIPQPISHLQSLLVQRCDKLRKIEINTVNLVKLHYEGAPMDLKFKHSSKLNVAHIHFINKGRARNLDFYLNKISNTLLRLRCLNLKITGGSQVANLPKGSNKFLHLTHLNWEWNDRARMSLHNLATILNVAPLLEEMKLSFLERVLEQPPQIPSMFRDMPPKHRHTVLKKIQLCGFCFDTWQIEIAVYLCNHALELESMMIDHALELEFMMIARGSNPSWLVSEEIREMGTMIIRQEIPANVKLVVL